GDAYITGSSASTNFPLRLPLQNINRGGNDAFVAKIKGDGSQLIYSTYLGGSLLDEGYGITVDAGGNAYVAGGTVSSDFNTANAFQPNNGGGGFDAFLAKINPQGSQLLYSTYLGGSLVDVAYDVAVDVNNTAYITGHTFSTNFPTQNPLQSTNAGEADAFIARFNVSGSALVYSTYLGGSAGDFARGIVVDSSAQPVIIGRTASTDYPSRSPLQATNRGNFDAFVSKLSNTGGQLVYSTYLGGASDDLGFGIAQDAANNVYVTGDTRSTDFNTKNPLQASNRGGLDAFVAKINSNGTDLTYSTYLGGSGEDLASSIALDTAGNAYITGYTSSNDYPTRDPIQATSKGGLEVFVTKIFADASDIAYNTYFGGNGSDTANSITVDTSGSCYITGATTSTNFPTRNPIQATNRGGLDAFVAKLNPSGTNIVYSTYLGGGFGDSGRSIAIDSSGNAYIAGSTFSDNFPTNVPFQANNRGLGDAFVARINASGTSLVYSSFLGGANTDEAAGIAVDSSGNAYVVGNTASNDFNTRNPLQTNNRGQQDIFITKINPTGSTLLYSTYLGGSRADLGNAIAIDQTGAVYITGSTISTNFPTLVPRQSTYGGGEQDAFVAKLNPAGSALIYSTYLGGLLTEVGNAIAVDPLGNAYVTGVTSSTNFPLKNPLQADNRGLNEAFITKYNQQGSDFVYSTYLGGSNSDQGSGIAVNAAGTAYVAGATSSANFNIQFPLVAYGGGTDVFVAKILSEPSLTLSPNTLELQAASTAMMTVTISAGQPQPVTVTLTSSASNLAGVPASVTIPANATTADFAVTGVAIGGPVTITAALSQALGGATATATVNVITSNRFINAGSVSVAAGGLATIPIDLISQGNENRVSFSLSLNPAVVPTTPFFTLGADATASGATLTTVPQQAQGQYGITIALPTGQTFEAGTRQILVVQPIVATGSGLTSTPIAFTDAPTVRRVADINGQPLSANYAPGTLTIASGYEGDVSPRPNGSNGTVTIADWVQTGRFAAGFDSVSAGSEFQRADCAPRATLGNGAITISDWVQAGRYASALDPVVPAGGPTGPAFTAPPALTLGEPDEAAQTRVVRLTSLATQRGQQFTTFVELDALGNENAFGFSVSFDTTQLNLVNATAGPDVSSGALNVNSSQSAQGRIGIALALPTGTTIAAGNARKLVALTFTLLANSTSNTLNLNFGDQPIPREIVSANADSLSATFINGTIFVAKPVTSVSAASFVGGDLAPEQIVAAFGDGLATTIQVNSTLPLPTTLGGTTVKVRDSAGVERSAGLFFVAPNQVNYLVPAGTANGAAIVTVTSGNNTLSVGTVNIAATAPGVFTSNASGQGLAAATVFRIAANGTQTFEPVGQFNAATSTFVPIPIDLGPAGDQVFLLLFGTGFRNGGVANVGVKIGGTTSEVLYAADAPGFVGLDQANVRIPRTLIGRGEVDVMMTVGAKTANTVKISIK
ncbi:MAG TPA: SBBP repeat-containing protein, partial [Blastocatellia bacterium]|nr:SBBP repeat-containing protein [Blastocatellia bacterium]